MLIFNGKKYFVPIFTGTGGDVLGADALPNQVIEGVKFVGAYGKIEEGTLPIHRGVVHPDEIRGIEGSDDNLYFSVPMERSVVENSVTVAVPARSFGNVEKNHVLQGYTFTSKDGLCVEGEMPIYDGEVLTAERNENIDDDSGVGFYVYPGYNQYMVQDEMYFRVPKEAFGDAKPILVASEFDNTGDGVPEVYSFDKELPSRFNSANVIQIDAVKDVTDDNGIHQEAGSHYLKYDEVAAGIGTLPPHVYCYDNSTNYLRYSFNVEEDGIYELAAHLRIKDEQLRGATYIINKGTSYEHAFVTTYGWDSEEEALAVRNNDSLQGSYMSDMKVHLHKGVNTIHITPAVGVTKNQHFRNLYLVKTDIFIKNNLTMDEAEKIAINLAKGDELPEYHDITVTFNNGAPRASDGFCRVITSNGHKMSIQKITIGEGQTMPLADETVTLRGKIGCVNSTVNGSIGKEARIFDATIVDDGIKTCNVTITIGASVGYVCVTATTFANGVMDCFSQGKSSGEFTINNVVCGSVISVICNNYFSISSSMLPAGGHDGIYSTLQAPSTAGNYTATITEYED